MIEPHIDTGDAMPQKYPVCWVPLAVTEELARRLQKIQDSHVIQPSNSPWAWKDRTLHFCVDSRGLNSVTKLAKFLSLVLMTFWISLESPAISQRWT